MGVRPCVHHIQNFPRQPQQLCKVHGTSPILEMRKRKLPEVKGPLEALAGLPWSQGSVFLPPRLTGPPTTLRVLSRERVTDGLAADSEDRGFTGSRSHAPLFFLLLPAGP